MSKIIRPAQIKTYEHNGRPCARIIFSDESLGEEFSSQCGGFIEILRAEMVNKIIFEERVVLETQLNYCGLPLISEADLEGRIDPLITPVVGRNSKNRRFWLDNSYQNAPYN